MNVPTIETARLLLRGHRREDLDAAAAMWSEPEVVLHISGKPSTYQQTWMRILGYAGHWQLMGFGYWAVEERETGRFAGELGFADFKRDIEPSISGMPEIGWALATPFHGRGYATEAVKAVVAWADAHLNATRTVCIITPENRASLRIAEKAGYHRGDQIDYNGRPTIVFHRDFKPGDR